MPLWFLLGQRQKTGGQAFDSSILPLSWPSHLLDWRSAGIAGLTSIFRSGHGLCYARDMTIKRLDHVSVVVDDLAAAIAFFTVLGMTIEGQAPIEGPWVDRVNGLEGVQVDIVMMRTGWKREA